MMSNKLHEGIQYVGEPGITAKCKEAIMRFIQFGDRITRVRILSCANEHGFLLNINERDIVAVRIGFSSGYLGEGPRGLSFILQNLETCGADIEEFVVDKGFLDRIDGSCLTRRDLTRIDAARPIRPLRWHNYIFDQLSQTNENGSLWHQYPPVIPWAIMDCRITDLALAFSDDPDDSLLKGYRRLEDIVRARTSSGEHGAALFSDAFQKEKGKLVWKGLNPSEHQGRIHLFTGAYMAYRNPRAHRELGQRLSNQLAEFVVLNHLYILEREASER